MNIYVNPLKKDEVTLEIINTLDSLPVFEFRKIKLEDLGLKSVDELVKKLKNDERFLLNVIRLFNEDAVIDDKEIDCLKLEEGLYAYKSCHNSEYNDKVMRIEIFSNGFRFGAEGDSCSWEVVQHPYDNNKVIVRYFNDGTEFAFSIHEYSEFSSSEMEVKNMEDLIEYLKKDPDWVVYMISVYQDFDYDRVEVVENPDKKV